MLGTHLAHVVLLNNPIDESDDQDSHWEGDVHGKTGETLLSYSPKSPLSRYFRLRQHTRTLKKAPKGLVVT